MITGAVEQNTAAASFRPRRDWGVAIRALRALMADKNDTEQVFRVMGALNADEDAKGYQRLLLTEKGGRVAYLRQELADRLMDRDWLATFPAQTVGGQYRAFLDATGYSADGLAEISQAGSENMDAEHPYFWMGRRSRDVHDIWHVLTGYKADEHLGEAALVAFSFGQLGGWGWGAIALAVWWETLSSGINNPKARAIIEGYRLGKAAEWLMAEDYERLLAEPLEDARRRLNLGRPDAYLSIPSPERAEGLGRHAKANVAAPEPIAPLRTS